jgi:integrase
MAERRPYTAASAAQFLGCSEAHIRNLCHRGKLRYFLARSADPHPGLGYGGTGMRIDGKPRRVALRTKDREVAGRRLIDLEKSLRTKASTIAEIMDLYLADKHPGQFNGDVNPTISGNERTRYAWLRLAPVFGHLRPDQVDRPLCRAYAQRRRRDGVKDGTIIKQLATLRAALRWHDKNTPAIIEMPPLPPPRSRHLSREQYRALRDAAAATPHLYLFVVLAYTTAGRASAILELNWDRVDFTAGMIRLGTGDRRMKGRATVPMTEGARAALTEAHRAAVSDNVVEYAGKPVRSVKRAFAAAAERAGVPWCTPHTLRHSAAVHMAEAGVPMAEISQYLGHSSSIITERVYARFSSDYLRRAASTLE